MSRKLKAIKWINYSSRQRMSPFPNYLSMESISNEMKKVIGFAYREIPLVYQHNLQTVFIDEEDYKIGGKYVLTKVQDDPDLFKKLSAEIKTLGERFINLLEQIMEDELQFSTSEELAEWFITYAKYYKQIYSRYFPILTVETQLSDKLRGVIAKRKLSIEESSVLFTCLTNQPEAMVNLQEDVSRLLIIERIIDRPIWMNIFLGTIEDCRKMLDTDPQLIDCLQLIKAHQSAYYWVTRDYEDPILTEDDVINKIHHDIQENTIENLRLKRAMVQDNPHKIAEAEQFLQLTNQEKKLFEAMRDGMYNKEQRKTIVSKSLYHFDKVLYEVEHRTNIPVRLIRFMKVDEPLSALNGQDMRELLEERFKLSVWLPASKATTRVLIEKEAQQWEKMLFGLIKNTTELKGTPISRGFVTGTAKIMMNPDEGSKIVAGDIIVTVQAVPSFSLAISRAAGIVADGGTGLTSHTATLAREFKIPGITGLKIATKIIKDGDIIEVNGDTGVLRIVKKLK